jgi:Zn-dependent protease with chaperone function
VDFYSRQAEARSQSRWFLAAFLLSVALVVVAINFVIVTAVVAGGHEGSIAGVVVATTTLTLAIICGASAYRVLSLRGGGGVVARSLGGTRVDRGTADPLHRRLLNVVEEMSIASGVPVPEVYVLEEEEGINAFAAGHLPANAAVAVTHGALKRLKREELQGVIAHEFSHVLNGDMALNIRLMGWLFGLLAIASIARFILRHGPRGGDDRKGGAGALIAVALAVMILGYVGVFFGRLLQAAVSRRRETLADASAVQFTRNPQGLKEALVKIAGHANGATIVAADGEEVAHMLFASGLQRFFATHPPLAERIRALDPAMTDRVLDRAIAEAARESLALVEPVADDTPAANREPTAPAPAKMAAEPAAHAGLASARVADNTPASVPVANRVGEPTPADVRRAHELHAAMIPAVFAAAETPERALPHVLAALMSRHPRVAGAQRVAIGAAFGADVAAQAQAAESTMSALLTEQRLPAVHLLFPALRRLTWQDRRRLLELLETLAAADASIDTFECALLIMLAAELRDELGARGALGSDSLAARESALADAFAILAQHGSRDDVAARRAYEAGLATVLPRNRPAFARVEAWPSRFASALRALESLHPYGQRAVVDGLAKSLMHDAQLTIGEAELLRAVCAVLRCPLPPILTNIRATRSDE